MTFSEEFVPVQDSGQPSNYPTAFGVTFTPPVIGGLLAALGLLAGLWLFFSKVKPAFEANGELSAQIERDRQTLEDQKKTLANRGEFEARQQSALAEYDQTMELFADEKSLDTLLLDISQQIPNPKEVLRGFTPEGAVEVVNDGSLGAPANGMLKRKNYKVAIEGTYQETQDFLDSLERLQPLMMVSNVQTEAAELVQEVNVGPFGQVSINRKDPELSTTLNLQALIERSREEFEVDRKAAAEAAAADPAADPATDPAAAPPK